MSELESLRELESLQAENERIIGELRLHDAWKGGIVSSIRALVAERDSARRAAELIAGTERVLAELREQNDSDH